MIRVNDPDELTLSRLKAGWRIRCIGSHYRLISPKGKDTRLSVAAFDRIADRLECLEKLGMKIYTLTKKK